MEFMNTQNTPEATKAIKKAKFWNELRGWVGALVVAVVAVLVIQHFLFLLIRVDGGSMNPTLLDGERLFVTAYDVRFGDVERGDVVICHYPNRGNTNFVKRIVAVPGDTVYREYGVTHVKYINEIGEAVDEALDPLGLESTLNDYTDYVLGEDEYFAVGDNRYNSHDSRDWNDRSSSNDVGPITKNMIVGHVRQVIWPLDAIRPVE